MAVWFEPPPRVVSTLTWTGSGQVREKTVAATSKWVTEKVVEGFGAGVRRGQVRGGSCGPSVEETSWI